MGVCEDMLEDISHEIWVPTQIYIPPNFKSNYSSIDENFKAHAAKAHQS